MDDQSLFDELAFYTLAHGDPRFIHQHAVDAFAAQNAGPSSKPISVVFGLAGLYLYLEKGFTGRQVQKAHMQLARRRKDWPTLALPDERGEISIRDVLKAETGRARDEKIREWSASVWEAWRPNRQQIVELVHRELGID
jgi:hypothetical protein